MNKLSATAKKLDVFFKIINIALTIAAVTSVVFLIIIAAGFLFKLDPDMIATNFNVVEFGFMELHIAPEFTPDKQLVLAMTAVQLALGSLCAMLGRSCVKSIRQILQPMIANEPFNSLISTNLKKLCVLIILIGVAYNCIAVAEQMIMTTGLDLPGLLLSEKITHITFNYTIDISFFAFSAVLLLLSYVFSYGEQLQQLSDETL